MAAGARGIAVQRRWAHVEELARRRTGGLSLVDPGSVNVGLTSDGAVPESAAAEPYQNSFADTEYMFARSAQLGAAPSISIFEPGFLRTTLTLHRHGRVPPVAIVELYFGGELKFGLPPTAAGPAAYPGIAACARSRPPRTPRRRPRPARGPAPGTAPGRSHRSGRSR
ncbi:3-keto-5-aminohexanoate cleavage protein [Pseudonocardia bannensis]